MYLTVNSVGYILTKSGLTVKGIKLSEQNKKIAEAMFSRTLNEITSELPFSVSQIVFDISDEFSSGDLQNSKVEKGSLEIVLRE